jgi:hypothetical protein
MRRHSPVPAKQPIGEKMRRTKRKTTIITETDRLLILNKDSGAVEGWCESCDELVGMVRPDEAVALAAFRLRSVYRALEPDKLHVIQNDDGLLHVCLKSLLKPA